MLNCPWLARCQNLTFVVWVVLESVADSLKIEMFYNKYSPSLFLVKFVAYNT